MSSGPTPEAVDRTSLRPLTYVGIVLAVVAGALLFWLQASFLISLANLGLGGFGLQNHLSQAADGLVGGDYEGGEAEYQEAANSAAQIDASAQGAHLDVLAAIPGIGVAIDNWRAAGTAATDLSDATGGLISLYGDLSGKSGGEKIFSDGTVNIAMLEELPPRVNEASTKLDTARTELEGITATTVFSDPLARIRERALREMRPVRQAVRAIEDIAPVLPDALGATEARRYLVAIGNQAEMRASGGAPLTLVMVEFDGGRVSIPIKGQTSTQLFPPLNAPVKWFGPALNPFFPGNPRNNPFVVTNTHPNLLYSAQEMAGAWGGGGYPNVDGVVFLDLTAIAAVLDATGPVQSAVYGEVTGDQLGQILLVDAYQDFGQDDALERQAANQQLLDELLGRLLSGKDLVNAAQAIASTAPGRHFQMWMRNPTLQKLAMDAGAAGVVEEPPNGDWSAMYTQNGNQSKVDVFQQRNVLVTVNMGEDGSARVVQQLTLTNNTPADRPEGPPERVGYETMWLKNAYVMYVPEGARNFSVSYPDGFNVRPFKGHARQQLGSGWVNDGFGNTMVRVVGWTPPGGQTAVSISYDLPAGTFSTNSSDELVYRLRVDPQALFLDPTVSVTVTPPPGFQIEQYTGMVMAGETASVSAVLDRPLDIGMTMTRTAS